MHVLFIGQRPGMLLNILQCTGQTLTTKNVQPRIPSAERMRNPELSKGTYSTQY